MKINKTDTGYVLRQSRFLVVSGGLLLFMGIGFTALLVLLLPSFDLPEDRPALVYMICTLALLYGAGGYLLVANLGRRMVLDGEGVRLRATLLKERLLPWASVRDLGITHKDGQGRQSWKRTHYLYVSPTRLGTDGHIRVIRSKNRALCLTVSRGEIDELYALGVMDRCTEWANRGKEGYDRVAAYSSLEVTEG